MCFWVDAETLEPEGCAFYDAYAFTDPLPVKTMELAEWNAARVAAISSEKLGT